MIGTGGMDVSRMMTMMGFGDGGSFERLFYRNQSEVCRKRLIRCRKIVRIALLYEVIITFREKCRVRYQ